MRDILKVLYIMAGILLLFLFSFLYLNGRIPYSCINLVLLSIAPICYLCKGQALYVLLAASWLLLFPFLAVIYKIDLFGAAYPVLIFNGLLFAFERSRNMLAKTERFWHDRLEIEDLSMKELEEEVNRLKVEEGQVREGELNILALYEITKKMSGSLKLDDIVNIFSTFLKENFIFRKSELLILKESEEGAVAHRSYQIWRSLDSTADAPGIDYEAVIRLLIDNKKEAYFSREKDADTFDRLRVASGVKTIACIPLLSEKKLVGVLAVEDLPHLYFEMVVILVMQFSLEIKKVLLYEMVEELAITDGLTGLYVRRYFFERFREEMERSRRYKFKFAFLMADIDDFKRSNDTYGHLVGDVVLKEVANIIKQSVREIDLVARYGGEEFSLVLPETDKDSAKLVADRIRKRIEENIFKAYDEKLNVTISIGVSAYPEDSDRLKDLVEKADKALYAAKASGKNVVCMFEK